MSKPARVATYVILILLLWVFILLNSPVWFAIGSIIVLMAAAVWITTYALIRHEMETKDE